MRLLRVILCLLLLAMGCARFQNRPLIPSETAVRLDQRSLTNAPLQSFIEANRPSPAPWPPAPWDFETLFFAALYYHPSLDLARAQWQTAVGGNRTAAAHPNPTLSAIPGYDLSATSGLSPWIPSVIFDLPLETGGKRRYRMAQAERLTEAARLNIAVAAWQVRSNLRSSLIDFSVAAQREALLARQRAAQERIIQLLEQQLKAGAISNSELTLMRIALSQILLDLADARQQSVDARARVAEAIGVPYAALDGIDLQYRPPHWSADDTLLSPQMRTQALISRADLLESLAEYEAAQASLRLQIAKQYPDLHLGPGYQYDQGDHKITLSLTAELPILNQNQGPIAEAEGRRTEAAARFLALQAKVMSDIDRAVAGYRAAQSNLQALEALAAEHRRRNEMVEAQVRAGAAEQLDLLNSQIEVGAGELLQLTGRLKLQQSYGALEDAIQRPLDVTALPRLERAPRPEAFQEIHP